MGAWAAAAVAGVALAVATWAVLAPARVVGFQTSPHWLAQRVAAILARWESGWSPVTRQALDVLEWSQRDLQRLALGIAGMTALLMAAALSGSGLVWPGVVLIAAGTGVVVAYGGLPWWIQRQARQFRAGVMANYAIVLVMLRFYLALDYTPLDALTAIVPLLGIRGRRELRRILTDIRTGSRRPPEALAASRQRIQRMQWGMLMDTLAQNWGRRLRADALRPLTGMLASYRDQAARRLTSRLDMVVTIVPIMAIFGTLVGGMFVLLIGLVTQSGLTL